VQQGVEAGRESECAKAESRTGGVNGGTWPHPRMVSFSICSSEQSYAFRGGMPGSVSSTTSDSLELNMRDSELLSGDALMAPMGGHCALLGWPGERAMPAACRFPSAVRAKSDMARKIVGAGGAVCTLIPTGTCA
jgi:hypothetical protein